MCCFCLAAGDAWFEQCLCRALPLLLLLHTVYCSTYCGTAWVVACDGAAVAAIVLKIRFGSLHSRWSGTHRVYAYITWVL